MQGIVERQSWYEHSGGLTATYYALHPVSRQPAHALWTSDCFAQGVCDQTVDFRCVCGG